MVSPPHDHGHSQRDEPGGRSGRTMSAAIDLAHTLESFRTDNPFLHLFAQSPSLAPADASSAAVTSGGALPAACGSLSCAVVPPARFSRSFASVPGSGAGLETDVGGGATRACVPLSESQYPTKGGVSERPEDTCSDPRGTEPYLRAAGCVRGPVVGSSPGRRLVAKVTKGAVTPSVHLGVPKSLAVTPGRGLGLRQQLGWKKVCGTARSGIWVLKCESRGYALPSTLDHLGVVWMEKRTYSTPGSHLRTPVLSVPVQIRAWSSSRTTIL